ncbi:MAG: hypothetical protein MHM6MM_006381 [Cercozoa sp. M6MM]
MRTRNPIREIVDTMRLQGSADKPVIPLSIGDPTVFGNLPFSESVSNAVISAVKGGESNGYVPAVGIEATRAAIAERFSRDGAELTAQDVVLASGASGALDLALCALCSSERNDNILLPSPGFSLYSTLCERYGVEIRKYPLVPEQDWNVDVAAMEALIDENTRAILVNNPSNPCGSVYSAEHLREILAVAEKHCLPIITDEIYADMVFSGETFVPMASLTSEVPILSVGGLAKQFLVPGWRMGWVLIHDRHGRFAEVRAALAKLATLILGPNSLCQAAIPEIFSETEPEFYAELNATLERHTKLLVDRIAAIPGLTPIVPKGAMYLMIKVDIAKFRNINNDVDFARRLLNEQFVFVLPGKCFGADNFFRVVTCPPPEKLAEACDRIAAFCSDNYIA